jgi:integrase
VEAYLATALIKAQSNGRKKSSVRIYRWKLERLARETNMLNPEMVKEYISKLTYLKTDKKHRKGQSIPDRTKNDWVIAYNSFCEANKIKWVKPKYKWADNIPLIPTTDSVNKIISSATARYAVIFTMLAETATEGKELEQTSRREIDAEQGIIVIKGTKGHDTGKYKLKEQTANMLRFYLADNRQEYPFPRSEIIGQVWRETRERASIKHAQPQLREIPLKNLRNYAGAIFYNTKGKDPIATQRFMRHKKLETTQHYLKAIVTNSENDEWITKAVKLGTPTTIQEIIELSNEGFTRLTEADGYQLYRKLK